MAYEPAKEQNSGDTGGKQTSGGGGMDMLSGFTALGDKLHNNFETTLSNLRARERQSREDEFAREQWAYNKTRSWMDELQRRRETMFGQGLQTRQMAMNEKQAALQNRANEYSLRKAIEGDAKREDVTKNIMLGMMSAIGSTGRRA